MKEPCNKAVENHLDPESCADASNPVGGAVTGTHAGKASDSQISVRFTDALPVSVASRIYSARMTSHEESALSR
jgi:hypothetical protein